MSNALILILSIIAAMIPTMLFAGLIYWVDRYEKEPFWLLSAAFFWGAVPSIILAFFFNSILSAPFYSLTDAATADALAGTLIAPPVEEMIKGLAILGIFLFWRQEIDSPLDGIIYGAMVGMGFAMVENVYYFVNVFQEGGLEAWGINIFLRALIFGLNHALFTSMTGLGIAIARLSTDKLTKIFAPILGFIGAVLLHFIHNLAVSLENAFCFIALITDWGGIILITTIIIWALTQERSWIKKYLLEEVAYGTITIAQYRQARSPARRTNHRLKQLSAGGFSAYLKLRDFYHRCSELAYKKHHLEKFHDKESARLIKELRKEVATLSEEVQI